MNFYEDMERVYAEISAKLPRTLNRDGCEESLRAGEPEYALTELLELAFKDGSLTEELLDEVESKVDSVPVEEMISALRDLMKRNSAA